MKDSSFRAIQTFILTAKINDNYLNKTIKYLENIHSYNTRKKSHFTIEAHRLSKTEMEKPHQKTSFKQTLNST